MGWRLKTSRTVRPTTRISAPVCIGIVVLLLLSLLPSIAGAVAAQASPWSEPLLLSTTSAFSWFPDIVTDNKGNAHVVWDSSPDLEKLNSNPLLLDAVLAMYTTGRDDTWTRPNDIAYSEGRAGIFRASLAADSEGNIYLASALHGFTAAQADDVTSAQLWREPQTFMVSGASYGSAMTVDNDGTIHLLWDWLIEVEVPDPTNPNATIKRLAADVFYRSSSDGGRTWSPRSDLSNTDVGEAREQIKVDKRGVIYVGWETGWDRQTEEVAKVRAVVFRSSHDGGETWSDAKVFDTPDEKNVQMTIQPDDHGGVMALWRSERQNDIYYVWSRNEGRTWSEPQAIPTLLARRNEVTRFDGYHMAVDSAGIIHLVAVGRLSLPEDSGVYHLTWDGSSWSEPEAIYTGEGWPEWPRIAIAQGNKMHVVWFVRNQLGTGGGLYKIYYSTSLTDAPELALVPTPTPSPTPAPPTPTPEPTRQSLPDFTGVDVQVDPTRLRTENDDVSQLALAMTPLVVLLGAVVVVARSIRRR